MPAAPEETQFIQWLGRIRRALIRELEARAREYEITAPQVVVLKRLWVGDGMLTSVLASETGCDGATLTGVLDRLEARGLLRRERSREDRRAVRILLTDAGRALEDPMLRILAEVNELALEGLAPAEREALVGLLERVGGTLGA